MRVFVAIPVESQLDAKINPLHTHKLFAANMRPSHIEPHITLKAPQEVSDIKPWAFAARGAISAWHPAQVRPTKVDFITPHTLALFLEPTPLAGLESALAGALAAYNTPDIELHEGSGYHPHVTIGRSDRKFTPVEQAQLINLAESYLRPYPRLDITKVRLYGHDGHRYYPLEDIEL